VGGVEAEEPCRADVREGRTVPSLRHGYEKLKGVYLGVPQVVFGFIYVRRVAQPVSTP